MTDPFPNIQTKLVYGTNTTTEESRVNGNEYVVITRQNANRTYATTSSAHATPVITTVTDNVTSVYSGRPSYAVSTSQTEQPPPQSAAYHNNTPTNVRPLTAFLNPNYTSPQPQPNCPNNYYPGPTPQTNNMNYGPPQQSNLNNTQAAPNYYVQLQSQQNETHTFTKIEVFHPNTVQPVIQATNYPQPMVTSYSDNSLGTGAAPAIEQRKSSSNMSTSTDDMDSEECKCKNTKPKTENKFNFKPGSKESKEENKESSSDKTESIGTQTPRTSGEIETAPKPEVELADELREYINNCVDEYLKDEKKAETEKERSLRDELTDLIKEAVNKCLHQQEETKAIADSLEEVKKCITDAVRTFKIDRFVATINEVNDEKNILKPAKRPEEIPNIKVNFGLPTININFTESPIPSISGGTRVDPLAGMNYFLFEKQLEEWYLDLEQSERLFINQVSETIRRDMILMEDKDKLTGLQMAVRWNKDFAHDIEIEHDFIDCQHRQIDSCINQLANIYDTVLFNFRDQRAILYNSVLNNRTQKTIMTNDLELIIEMANILVKESAGNVKKSKTEKKDTLFQVIRILNIHMNTLHGIDKKVTILKNELILVNKMVHDIGGPRIGTHLNLFKLKFV